MSTKHYTAEAFRAIAIDALETLLESGDATDISTLSSWTNQLGLEIKDSAKGIMSEELGERSEYEDPSSHYADVDGEDLENGAEFE